MAVERGCGEREEGGIYMVTPLTSGPGRPVEDFLVCPPQEIPDPAGAGISPVGVKALDLGADGIHVVDWVGSEHYPLVTDFVEEAKRYGISRRLPKSFPFSVLRPDSMVILLHARAYITNWEELVDRIALADQKVGRGCPLKRPEHAWEYARVPVMCDSLWWEDGQPTAEELAGMGAGRQFWRERPSLSYEVRRPPDGFHTKHVLAVFGRFPIIRLEVIADPNGGTHEEALDKIGKCSLPVAVVKE